MGMVLISTVYGPDPVLLACTKVSPNKLVLLVNDESDKTTKASLDLIKKSIGRVIDVEVVKIPQYDVLKIAETMVKIIDKIPISDHIMVNITSGRKTQSMGVLFGAYARKDQVKKIAYYPDGDEKGNVVYLPVLSMKLSDSQEKILGSIENNKIQSYKSISESTGLSSAMVYRAIDELMTEGLIEKTQEEGIVLTDAGKIMRL